jgi:hypothetical protein
MQENFPIKLNFPAQETLKPRKSLLYAAGTIVALNFGGGVMNHTIFAVSLLLPAVVLCLVVLSTFYGWVKAYLAICWVPLALYLIVQMFLNIGYQPSNTTIDLDLMLKAIGWTAFVQGLFGVVLTLGVSLKKEEWVIPAIATLIAVLPFFLIK